MLNGSSCEAKDDADENDLDNWSLSKYCVDKNKNNDPTFCFMDALSGECKSIEIGLGETNEDGRRQKWYIQDDWGIYIDSSPISHEGRLCDVRDPRKTLGVFNGCNSDSACYGTYDYCKGGGANDGQCKCLHEDPDPVKYCPMNETSRCQDIDSTVSDCRDFYTKAKTFGTGLPCWQDPMGPTCLPKKENEACKI